MRNQKDTYCFITDGAGKFYTATQAPNGNYLISSNSQPATLQYNPINLIDCPIEFGTNEEYMSLVRSVAYPLKFVKDGAAILRDFYYLGKGTEAMAYLTILDWDGTRNLYTLSYRGRFDFLEKQEDPKAGMFTIPLVDDSAWGILSNNDKVEYAIECNETNPKAIRVLFDGLTLVDRFTYQTVQALIRQPASIPLFAGIAIPFVIVNEDGDSSGVITKSQTGYSIPYTTPGSPNFDDLKTSPAWFMSTAYAITGVHIEGTWKFQYNNNAPLLTGAGIELSIRTSFGRRFLLYRPGRLVDGQIYTTNFTVNLDLGVAESMFMVLEFGTAPDGASHVTITPIVTNTVVSIKTTPQPVVRWGLRPLDLLQQLVAKGTNNRYTIGSDFFTINNKDIALSGDSLRGIANAKIYSSFSDFFNTFSHLYFMALRNIIGQLWMEQAIEVYKQNSTIIDIGNAIDVQTTSAKEYYANEIVAGSPDVDLRHPSGRLEFNTEDGYSLAVLSSKRKVELITKYRTGCFDITFLIQDYLGDSSQDNSGDKTVYLARITDEQGGATQDIETFENVNIDNALLEPILKSPLNNDVITNNKPVIRGTCNPGLAVNIYVDTVLDGGTVSDANGNWSYNIVTALSNFINGVQTGIHVIDATFTDLSAPVSTISVLINTDSPTLSQITYPSNGDSLYNNLPLVKGVAQTGTVINLLLDGFFIATVTADASCKWEYKIITPFLNANHTLSITGDSVDFNVNSAVAYPLITYIGSELDGFPLWNNLPLIRGVAMPGVTVELWLNYIDFPGSMLGTAITDANCDWSYQVVPTTYPDPITGLPIVLAPIQNGLNIISTSIVNHVVPVGVSGYKLERPAYSSITGVTDNTVFNTAYRPANIMKAHFPLFASMMAKQQSDSILYQTSKKNGNLRTVLNGVTLAESDDIPASSLGKPLLLLEKAKIKTKVRKSFARLLENFGNGGIIKTNYRGTDLFCLPIGTMKMSNIKSDVQEWELLMSPLTSYVSLLNLYKNGTIINIMKNSIYHSDFNTLHFVVYDYQLPRQYKVKDIYDDWFKNRNEQWLYNPDYIQKIEIGDPIIIDQVITNGISNMTLGIYRCKDAILIDTLKYEPITPAPIAVPEVVMECKIDWSKYPAGRYFCVQKVGSILVAISEKIETKEKWAGTILIESSNSLNMVGCFFSTGFQTQIRVEGLVKKRQSEIEFISSKDESGNTETLYQTFNRERMIRFGTAYGLPDYLYLKIVPALTLDMLRVEGVYYDLKEGDKVSKSDDIDGHPLYYYEANLTLKSNPKGMTIEDIVGGGLQNARRGVVLVVDATAFGLPIGSLINIELNNEHQ